MRGYAAIDGIHPGWYGAACGVQQDYDEHRTRDEAMQWVIDRLNDVLAQTTQELASAQAEASAMRRVLEAWRGWQESGYWAGEVMEKAATLTNQVLAGDAGRALLAEMAALRGALQRIVGLLTIPLGLTVEEEMAHLYMYSDHAVKAAQDALATEDEDG